MFILTWFHKGVGALASLRVFLRVLRFSSLHKNQHSQISIRPGNVDERAIEMAIYYYLL